MSSATVADFCTARLVRRAWLDEFNLIQPPEPTEIDLLNAQLDAVVAKLARGRILTQVRGVVAEVLHLQDPFVLENYSYRLPPDATEAEISAAVTAERLAVQFAADPRRYQRCLSHKPPKPPYQRQPAVRKARPSDNQNWRFDSRAVIDGHLLMSDELVKDLSLDYSRSRSLCPRTDAELIDRLRSKEPAVHRTALEEFITRQTKGAK